MDGEEEYVVRSVPHYAGGSKNIRAHKGKGNLHGTAELGLTEVVWVLTLIMVVYALYRWLRHRGVLRSASNRRAVLTLVVLCGVGGMFMFSDSLNEMIEMHIVRSDFFHNMIQSAKNHTRVPWNDTLIVHQHIPRTGSDSMRTHLFFDSDRLVEFGVMWMSSKRSPPQPFTAERFPDIHDKILHDAAVLKGFLSRDDIDRIATERDVVRYTILRHPIERALSFYNYVGRASHPEEFFNKSSAFHSRYPRTWVHTSSFVENSMTWQLGGQMHARYRRTRHNYTDAEILARAKRSLCRMKYVGFFENLASDFLSIWSELYWGVDIPYFYPLLFYLGTLFAIPRMRILRYSARMDPKVVEMVKELNRLDLELYEWARREFSPHFNLYTSYEEMVRANVLFILALVVALCAVSGAVLWIVWRFCCCCLSKQHMPSGATLREGDKAV